MKRMTDGMERTLQRRTPAAVMALLLALVTLVAVAPQQEASAAITKRKGATFLATGSNAYSTAGYRATVNSFKAQGGTDVALIYSMYQDDVRSSAITGGNNTVTDASLISGINYARSRGLRVMVDFKMEVRDYSWRADINPSNRNTWYANYQAQLVRVARIAHARGASVLSIGTEMYLTASSAANADNTRRWTTMITAVRKVFKGQLTYGTQHSGDRSELLSLGFGSRLDYIGVSAYFALTASGSNQAQALANSWAQAETRIKAAYNKYRKPILFTEIGYRSVAGAHTAPWDYSRAGAVDLAEQSRDYEAMFKFWYARSYFAGTYIWAWEPRTTAGGTGDTSFTPQNKPAIKVMCRWYSYNGKKNCAGGSGL